MAEYLAILIGAGIGFVGSILSAVLIIGRLKAVIVAGLLGLVLGSVSAWAFAERVDEPRPERLLEAPFAVSSYFYPTGWMGDARFGSAHMQFDPNHRACPRADDRDDACIRMHYVPGTFGWAGIYYQFPENNWGDYPGSQIKGASRVTWWARGAVGGELVEFKAGGINAPGKPYSDCLQATDGQVSLGTEWRHYELRLPDTLSQVIGAFAVVFPAQHIDTSLTIFIDDIRYE